MTHKQNPFSCIRIVVLILIVILSMACGSTPTPRPRQPRRTRAPTSTPTPTLTPIPAPTPTPDPVLPYLDTVVPLCEKAYSRDVKAGLWELPALGLFDDWEKPGWHARNILPFDPHAVAETKTLICIVEIREKVGEYTDGASAYRLYWSVRLVSVPDGEVVGKERFRGTDPPKLRKSTESGTGGAPSDRGVLTWLTSLPGKDPILNVGKCRGIVYSPQGEALALGCAEIPPAAWNVATGEQVSALDTSHSVWETAAFAPDGQTLAFVTADGIENVGLYDIATGEELAILHHTSEVKGIAFSPDGQVLASGTKEGIRLWNVADGQENGSQETDPVESLAFSPDGQTLASGHEDGTIRLWQLTEGGTTGEPLLVVRHKQETPIMSLAFSPDGQILISGGRDGTRFWSLASDPMGNEVAPETMHYVRGIESIAFSADGRLLALGSSTRVRLYEMSAGEQVRELVGASHAVFSPDGKALLTVGGNVAMLWSLASSPVGGVSGQ